ncbi:metallophosphoesterase [Cyanobium sp. WAJ14-Wanaka]|nr:metallophosphoesterase [Cyanobium sp. WAJ14-Wanaka]
MTFNRRFLLKGLSFTVKASLAGALATALAATVQPALLAQNAPPKAVDSTRFFFTADMGSGLSDQKANGNQMALIHGQRPVDFVILGGDNIYPDGNLTLVETHFNRPYAALLKAGVPFHAVLGNHDIRTGNGDPQVAYKPFGMKGRWYTLRKGPIEFFMLDTNTNAQWQFQMPWLKNALAKSSAPWKVVVGHHPIYSAGLYGDDPSAIAKLTPIFAKYGVQLYLNGHEHNYERTKNIKGTTYIISGNGGAYLRPIVANERSVKVASTFGFLELAATPSRLRVDAWSSSGAKVDEVVLTRP